MSGALDLKTEWKGSNWVRVSWQEPHKHSFYKGRSNAYFIAAFLGLVIPMFQGMSQGTLAPMGISVFWIIGCSVVYFRSYWLSNKVVITPQIFWCSSGSFDADHVTRIAVGDRANFTDNKAEHVQPKEIRGWVAEQESFIISSNNWNAEVNGRIRNAIDMALQEVRKTTVEVEREETKGKEGDFGVPEY